MHEELRRRLCVHSPVCKQQVKNKINFLLTIQPPSDRAANKPKPWLVSVEQLKSSLPNFPVCLFDYDPVLDSRLAGILRAYTVIFVCIHNFSVYVLHSYYILISEKVYLLLLLFIILNRYLYLHNHFLLFFSYCLLF